jgi:NADH-quinone oxidoreductase subunit J
VTARDLLFALCGVLAAACGLLAVTSRQVVHAALWLVTALGAIAGCYLVLGAEVVALVQVLVYVGAVVVLVLFALMLTRAPIGRSPHVDAPWPQRIAAAVAGAATAGLLGVVLLEAVRGRLVDVDPGRGAAQPLARSLFGSWALPFELLSLLLLAALVAALVLSRDTLEPGAGEDR